MEKEQLVFRLAALPNEAWFYGDTDRRKIQYTGLQSVTLNNTTLDCKTFFSDSIEPLVADDESTVLLAPEIGFAMEAMSGGGTQTLTKAIIDGAPYQF